MKHILTLSIVLALGASGAQAKAARCTDPTTHKFIKCTAATTASPPIGWNKVRNKPSVAGGPMQSPAPTPGSFSAIRAEAVGGAPQCKTGKVCGHSCIAVDKVCHKPS